MLTVLEVPQWQGSGSPTARRLVDGAARLAAMVPADRHVRVDAGGSLAENAERVRSVYPTDGFTVTVGGDCGVDLVPVATALRRYGDRLTVVWFDAHADMNSPATSPAALIEQVAALAARHEIVGLCVTEYAPADPRDEEMLARLVPELVRVCSFE